MTLTKQELNEIWEKQTKEIIQARQNGYFSLAEKLEKQLLNIEKLEATK